MSAHPTRALSRRERQIMDVLFERGESTVAEVLEGITDPPSYSAVRATLRVLEEKGQVRHRQDGPRYVYLPALEPEQARMAALQHLVRTFFDGSAEQAVVALLGMSDTRLPRREIERLAREIREGDGGG